MAQQVLSYPFRFDPKTGAFASVYQDTDTYKAQQVAAFIRTQRGEREILTSFGMNDPTFHTFDTGEFYDSFSDFYTQDDIIINEISLSSSEGRITDVVVSFD